MAYPNLSFMTINTSDLEHFEVIGKGSYGVIFLDPGQKFVVKALYDSNLRSHECESAAHELNIQRTIFQSFEKLKALNTNALNKAESSIVNHVRRLLRVSEPLFSYNSPMIIQGEAFKCFFVMEYVPGVPTDEIAHVSSHPRAIIDGVAQDRLQVHVAFNGIARGLVGSGMDKPVSVSNPPRGYYASKDEVFQLLVPYNVTVEEIESVMRLLYMWVVFDADLIPYDIEITLGVDFNGGLSINLMDFGMVAQRTDSNIDTILGMVQSEPYVDMLSWHSVNDTIDTIELCAKLTGKNLVHSLIRHELPRPVDLRTVPEWADA